jgi:homoserine dehydrogenase
MDRVRIGLVGFGTVGESLYRLLTQNAEGFARQLGVSIEVPWVGVRDASRSRRVGPGTRVVAGWREILEDPDLPIVVELAGGAEAPLPLVREALARGKHVITANKAMLSAHGQELFALAASHGVELKFEAAVCGGIPIIKVLRESLMGNRIRSIVGIVNGTTNYILTRMTEDKLTSPRPSRRRRRKASRKRTRPSTWGAATRRRRSASLRASPSAAGWSRAPFSARASLP